MAHQRRHHPEFRASVRKETDTAQRSIRTRWSVRVVTSRRSAAAPPGKKPSAIIIIITSLTNGSFRLTMTAAAGQADQKDDRIIPLQKRKI